MKKISKKRIVTAGVSQTKLTQEKAIRTQSEQPCANGGTPDGLEAWTNFAEVVDRMDQDQLSALLAFVFQKLIHT